MIYIDRTLGPVIERASRHFKVVAVTGMRQVGKSTLLRHMAENRRAYVTLDDRIPLDLAVDAREVFFKQYPPPLLIDEIQRAPGLCLEIKSLVDRSEERGQVWLTGSQRFGVREGIAESLAGRAAAFELFPFSLYERQNRAFEHKPYLPNGEILRGTLERGSDEDLWRMIWQGAWPDLLDGSDDFRDAFYESLLRTYVERDVIRTGVRNLRGFETFLRVLTARIGQEFVLGSAAADAGISLPTAKDWLSIAEASGVIYLLPPFYENVAKTVIKKPKIYFTDTGFAAWLSGSPSPEGLRSAYNAGSYFENFVIMEIMKSWVHNGRRPLFYFYRDTRRNEVDLLILEGGVYHPVEIKMTAHPTRSMTKAFDCIRGEHVVRGAGALICLCGEPRYLAADVAAISVWDL